MSCQFNSYLASNHVHTGCTYLAATKPRGIKINGITELQNLYPTWIPSELSKFQYTACTLSHCLKGISQPEPPLRTTVRRPSESLKESHVTAEALII